MNATGQQTREGERAWFPTLDRTRMFPVWTGVIYEARRDAQSGLLLWNRIGTFGGTEMRRYSPSRDFVRHLRARATCLMRPVSHGVVCQ